MPPLAPDVAPPEQSDLRRFGPREAVRIVEVYVVAVFVILRGLVRRRNLWDAVVDAFFVLGPTFVKLGQMIASSPGLFPKALADACLRCLDEVPPFPAAIARQIVAEDVGQPIEFDPEPLSAASIAQVHACRLPDGREAVLKIQRPNIAERMNRDLRIMYRIARALDHTRRGHLANVVAVVEDLHQVTNEELDFTLEARRQAAFRDNIGAFGDNKWITAPEVYFDWCGPRVIAMERFYGTPMDDFDVLRRNGVDGELVLRRGVKVWMEAALVHGPFHGDVHAGNLWVLDDGRAAYLDFGIMGELPPGYRDALKDAQYTTMIDGDYTRIVRAWKKLGILSEGIGDDETVAAVIKGVMEPMLDLAIGDVSLGELMDQQMKLAEQYGARAQRELVLVSKQLLYFERYAKELAPTYKMSRDLFLVKNVFPEEVAAVATERGAEFPD